MSKLLIGFLGVSTVGLLASTITLAVLRAPEVEELASSIDEVSTPFLTKKGMSIENVCKDKKPIEGFENRDCFVDNVINAIEQAGGNVTEGYIGSFDAGDRVPNTDPFFMDGLCPVNVHWHTGAEHLSVGQFDEEGHGPSGSDEHRNLSDERMGNKCHHYDEKDSKFTVPYEWNYCKDMHVGETYEIHWPHSAAGACGTPNQYQTPFYDGVFCMDGIISLDPLNTYMKIGVQAQVFTIVNDEDYYYPDLFKGMIVEGVMGKDVTKYTGSTTGTSRDNTICSGYTPITWQVDRNCHMISASSFDKMCADMTTQNDDMSADTHPHGARMTTLDSITANNQHHLR